MDCWMCYKKTFATNSIAGLYRGFFWSLVLVTLCACACKWQYLKITPLDFRDATSFLQLRMMKFFQFFHSLKFSDSQNTFSLIYDHIQSFFILYIFQQRLFPFLNPGFPLEECNLQVSLLQFHVHLLLCIIITKYN